MKKHILKITFFIPSIVITIIFILGATESECYHYVENICDNASLYNLDDFVDYNMLSQEYKEQISKDEFKFKNDEDIFFVAQKFKIVKSNYNIKTTDTSTKNFKHNPLSNQITIDGISYAVGFNITFSPKIFSLKPKIVDWEVNIQELPISE